MNRRSMIATGAALVILLGGVAGAYYYVDHKKDNEEAAVKEEKDALNLFSFDSNTVKGIDITNSEGHFNLTLDKSGNWNIEETDYQYSFTPYSYYLNVIAASMSRLKADHKADFKEGDMSRYGLDSPVTIVCHTDDKDYTLLVGNSSATEEFCYVMIPGDDTVYCINNDTGKELQCDISKLRDPYIFKCDDNDIIQFSLVHNGETSYDLQRNFDGDAIWTMNAPETDVSIDAITVNTVLTNLVRVQAGKFEGFTKDENELAKYGLDKPAYTFTAVTDEKTYILEFPEFGEDAEEVWCYDADSCAVCSISINNAAFLSGKWHDLTAKQAMREQFMSVSSLEIDVEGEKHKLSMDHEAQKYIFDDTEVTALGNDDAAANFEYLFASVSEMEHADYRDDVPEKMGKPTCTFSYTLTDGTKRELALVPIDDESYWAYIDGKCVGMTVNRSALESKTGCKNYIEILKNEIGN